MISVVIPCYNELAVLPQLYARVTAAAESWGEAFEVVLVDDGSNRETWEEIERLVAGDARWKAVRFARNFGHQTAVSAGIAYAAGDALIIIDADLQDPPEELHRFLAKWREGYQVVYGIREKRKEALWKRGLYSLFYRLLARLAHISIPLDAGDFCLLDRRVADLLAAMPERNRFVRGLRAWIGFRQIGVPYERHARAAGESQYTLSRLIQLAADGVVAFSTAPLRLATRLGCVVSVVAFLGTVFTLVQRLFAGWFASIGLGPVPGFATIVIAILFLGGVQLLCLGIIGEYIGRIYDEVKGRPCWIVWQTLGFDKQESGVNLPRVRSQEVKSQ